MKIHAWHTNNSAISLKMLQRISVVYVLVACVVATTLGHEVDTINIVKRDEEKSNLLITEAYNLTNANTTKEGNWAYDVITAVATGLGIVPAGLFDHGLQFTILLASLEECLSTIVQIHYNLEYNLVNMFDRVLFGKLEPELLLQTKKVQSLPGTIFSVNHVKNNVVEIGHHVVVTTNYFTLPFNRGVIYTRTYSEPK